VERLRLEFDIEIAYRHFPLHPETPEEGLTLEQLFAGRDLDIPAMKARMTKLMAEEGLPYGERTMTYNSRLAQELAAWSETQPGGARIHDALFQAYFVRNVNLARMEQLVAITQEIGLPATEARTVLQERRFRARVDADWQRCHELGITGVPTFVIGNRGLVGAQSYEQLRDLALTHE
jgi:predicted DsbA family dithiol-disulfide isomerase